MDDSTLSKIKSGTRRVRVEELAAFAEVFEVLPDALLQRLEFALSQELDNVLKELHERREELLGATAATVAMVRRAMSVVGQTGDSFNAVLLAAVAQERAMLYLIDTLLELEADLRGEDGSDYPDSTELLGYDEGT